MKIYFSFLIMLLSLLQTNAQVKYKQHELDIIGDFRVLNNSKVYGLRASYTLFNLKTSDPKYSHPIQFYIGSDYATNTFLNCSVGIRLVAGRRNLNQTLYFVEDLHFITRDRIVEDFNKEEHIAAFGIGYKLKNDLGIEYLAGANYFDDSYVHNFAVAKTIHFQTIKRLRRKTKIQDCPAEQQ